MADFFSQDELKNITLTKELDIPNVAQFSRENPQVTLGDFKEHDELYAEEEKIDVTKLKKFENQVIHEEQTEASLHDKVYKTQKDKQIEVRRLRAKVYLSMFFIVTFIITGFVIYNLISTAILTNKASNNASKIEDLNKLIEKAKEQEGKSVASYIVIPEDLNLY